MTKLQEALVLSLKSNACNISDAIKKNNCSLEDFHSFMKVESFHSGFDEAKQLADDFARTQFMKLIQKGDRQAVIEYQKMLRQSDDANEFKKIRKSVMAVFIRFLNTKSSVLKEFCLCFNTSKNTAEDYYKTTIIEYSLKSPNQRRKEEAESEGSKMYKRFNEGRLDETEMYQGLLSKALYDAEHSEYPSERKGARDDVIKINQRLDEVNERQRREAEEDDDSLIDGFDSLASGMKPSEIQAYRDILFQETLAIENAES